MQGARSRRKRNKESRSETDAGTERVEIFARTEAKAGEAAVILVPTADVVTTNSLLAPSMTPHTLGVARGERLLGGELYARLSFVD